MERPCLVGRWEAGPGPGARVVYESEVLEFLGWGDRRWRAWIDGDEFVCAPDGDRRRRVRSRSLTYVTQPPGLLALERWSLTKRGMVLVHRENGANATHEDSHVEYLSWDRRRWRADLIDGGTRWRHTPCIAAAPAPEAAPRHGCALCGCARRAASIVGRYCDGCGHERDAHAGSFVLVER